MKSAAVQGNTESESKIAFLWVKNYLCPICSDPILWKDQLVIYLPYGMIPRFVHWIMDGIIPLLCRYFSTKGVFCALGSIFQKG